MALTPEEITELEYIKASSKLRCREVYSDILKMQSILKSFDKTYTKYMKKYEKADHKLAMENIKIITPKKGKKQVTIDMTIKALRIEDVIELAEKLGIDLEDGEFKDGEG